jgi:hypothetical protein
MLLSAASVAFGLCLPVYAAARQAETGSEERSSRAEERAARAQERVAQREEARAARAKEREARRETREQRASEPAGEAGSGPQAGESNEAASPGARGACRASIEASSRRITAGETVSVSGTLECPRGASAADRQVAVYERQGAAVPDSASIAATASTGPDGSYTLTSPALYANTTFLVRSGRHMAHTTVQVAPLVTLAAASATDEQATGASTQAHVAQPLATTFTGTVSPAGTNARVVLQMAYADTGERWRSVAFGRVGADGTFSIAHVLRASGAARFRAVAHTGRLNATGVSAAVGYEVMQRQNPQLSIHASAGTRAYGQSVTISGVAAAGADQPVVLLARTASAAFGVVAQTTTNASGEYTFTQTPLQSTAYVVTVARTRSTTQLVDVGFALSALPAEPTARVGQQVAFSGTLSPAAVGQAVYLESGYASGAGFHVLATGAVESGSNYLISYTFARAGAVTLRIRMPGNGQLQSSTSEPFTVDVTD